MDGDVAWVAFSADHDWRPTARLTIAYKAGMRCPVTRACADEVVGAGKGAEIAAPVVDDAERLKTDPYWRLPPLHGEGQTSRSDGGVGESDAAAMSQDQRATIAEEPGSPDSPTLAAGAAVPPHEGEGG